MKKILLINIFIVFILNNAICQKLEFNQLKNSDNISFISIDLNKQKWIENIDGKYYCLIPFSVNESIKENNTFWLLISTKFHPTIFLSWGIYTETGEFLCKSYSKKDCPGDVYEKELIIHTQENLNQHIGVGRYFLKFFSDNDRSSTFHTTEVGGVRFNDFNMDVSVGASTRQFLNNFIDNFCETYR